MSYQTCSLPHGKKLTGGQPKSIQDTIHVLRHGAIERTGNARGALLADEMGTGKTIVAIVAANTLGFRRILVISPANLRETWVSEIRAWQTLGHLVIPVKATSQYGHTFLPSITSGWVVINYDILGRRPEIKAHPWDLLICDESHLLKNFKARRTCEVFGGKYQGQRIEPIPVEKAVVQHFQESPDCLFFIGNIRAAGIGITLTAACHVVFAELDWTPAVHHQAEDRAHRIGQAEQVKVVTFILDDENATDHQIYRLLKTKEIVSRQALNNAIVTGMTEGAGLVC
jgi:SNF2 family DNA or RNA helicase